MILRPAHTYMKSNRPDTKCNCLPQIVELIVTIQSIPHAECSDVFPRFPKHVYVLWDTPWANVLITKIKFNLGLIFQIVMRL